MPIRLTPTDTSAMLGASKGDFAMFRIRFTVPEKLPGSHAETVVLDRRYGQSAANQALFDFKNDDVYRRCGCILEVQHADGVWVRSTFDRIHA